LAPAQRYNACGQQPASTNAASAFFTILTVGDGLASAAIL
jgi:hypothetical protein